MKLFIPALGTGLRLTADWSFTLHREHRNFALMDIFAVERGEIESHVWTKESAEYELSHPASWRKNLRIVSSADTRDTLERDRATGRLRTIPVEMVNVEWMVRRQAAETPVTLPAGTELVVDRIYIRKGQNGFDSVTFSIRDCPDKRLAPKKAKGFMTGRARFWAKLDDVNLIECEVLP